MLKGFTFTVVWYRERKQVEANLDNVNLDFLAGQTALHIENKISHNLTQSFSLSRHVICNLDTEEFEGTVTDCML